MKKVIRNNIIGFIIAIVIFGSISVYATTQLSSNDVEYKDGKSTTQKLNELYQRQAALPKAYSVGDEITVAGEQYYVIADSPRNQDYVVALKAEPLTVEEVNANKIGSDGQNHVNRYTRESVGEASDQGYGGVAYYSSSTCGYVTPTKEGEVTSGCVSENSTNYDTSDIKFVVDKWAQTTFIDNELKIVGNYKARLVTFDEVKPIGWANSPLIENTYYEKTQNITPEWIWNRNFSYNTMTGQSNSTYSWHINSYGRLYNSKYIYSNNSVVRPVINVYKSKIQ